MPEKMDLDPASSNASTPALTKSKLRRMRKRDLFGYSPSVRPRLSARCSRSLALSMDTLHASSSMAVLRVTSSAPPSKNDIHFPSIHATPFPLFFLTALPPSPSTLFPSPSLVTTTPTPSTPSSTPSNHTTSSSANHGSPPPTPTSTGAPTTCTSNTRAAMSSGHAEDSHPLPLQLSLVAVS